MSVLPYQIIKAMSVGGQARALVHPFHEREVHSSGMSMGCGPASYDVCIAQTVEIDAGKTVDVSTQEWFNIPDDAVMMMYTKSTWLRRGIVIVPGGLADPGFSGNFTMKLLNVCQSGIIRIERGEPIGQAVFHALLHPSASPYEGKYQNSEGVQPAKKEGAKKK